MKKILIAALLATSGAWAHGNKAADADKKSDTMKTAMSDVSGEVSKFDKTTRSLTLALPSGDQQMLKIASDAKITCDGKEIGLDQLMPGDSVRASFDPKTNQAITLDVSRKAK